MDNFRMTAAAVCMVSAGICVVRSFVSGTSQGNKMEMILKMVFVVVLLAPFANGFSHMELPMLENYELAEYGYSKEKYSEELIKQTSDNLADALNQKLEANNIICGNLQVSVNISAEGSILISKVTVSADDFERAAEIIRNCLGSGTEVINGDN